jgi:Ran GTPase-activating protein (RanGAP) involved in mRNA processing and transport
MLHHNTGLTSLSLQNNKITRKGGEYLADAVLNHNRTLTSLNLHDNSGLTETMELIDKVLSERKMQHDALMMKKELLLLASGMQRK